MNARLRMSRQYFYSNLGAIHAKFHSSFNSAYFKTHLLSRFWINSWSELVNNLVFMEEGVTSIKVRLPRNNNVNLERIWFRYCLLDRRRKCKRNFYQRKLIAQWYSWTTRAHYVILYGSWPLELNEHKKDRRLVNRPFYSCLLSDLAFVWQRSKSWPCFDTDLTAFVM